MNPIALEWSSVNKDSPYWADFEGESLSYEEYESFIQRLVGALARRLRELPPGSIPIAVAIPEGPWLPIAVAAVHELNAHDPQSAVLVPVDPTQPHGRQILEAVWPYCVLTATDCDAEKIQTFLDGLANRPSDQQHSSGLYQRAAKPGLLSVQDLVDELPDHWTPPTSSLRTSNRLSHIVFASGTTGIPKGCMSSRHALLHYLQSKNQCHGIDSTSTVALVSPLSFDPCISDCLATRLAGATLRLVSRRELRERLDLSGVTHLLGTPTVWRTLQGHSDLTVALGGEVIPPNMVVSEGLLATYGVTEACVYQTIGKVGTLGVGQCVGFPFPGMHVHIWDDNGQSMTAKGYTNGVGEVVLSGVQLDEFSGYLGLAELNAEKFLSRDDTVFYRTGDRGYIHEVTGELFVLGRISKETGMVKFHGIRVELGEIESALCDETPDRRHHVVLDSIAMAPGLDESSTVKAIHVYLVLSETTLAEMGIVSIPENGVLCTDGPLLVLLQQRCRARARVVPTSFVLIPRIPLSPTGKRQKSGVPPMDGTVPLYSIAGAEAILLDGYGNCGTMVADVLRECLSLQTIQEALLTTTATFATLGGDSLAATRVARALYARHHGVDDTRFLGGAYGTFEGPFAVVHLLEATNLGSYVDWLDAHGVGGELKDEPSCADALPSRPQSELYEALFLATSRSWTSLAIGLLHEGVDPEFDAHGGRLGKVSGRMNRKAAFRSSPLHIACTKGNLALVQALVEHGANAKSPDPAGLFPWHLASGGGPEPDRLCIVQLLHAQGIPWTMKDGNRHSILHCAARSGHVGILSWVLDSDCPPVVWNWQDRWYRTAVHWAILNGHVDALCVLLEAGCDPQPFLPSKSRLSSAALETPMDLCRRRSDDKGEIMRTMLEQAMERKRAGLPQDDQRGSREEA